MAMLADIGHRIGHGHCASFLGVKSIVFSFGLHDERTHSPNEFYRISSFQKSKSAFAMLMKEMAK